MRWSSKKSDTDNAPPAKPRATPAPAPPVKPRATPAPAPAPTTDPLAALAAAARPPVAPQPAAKPPVARDDLPRFLIAEGHISEQDVRYAIKMQQETGVFFGEILAKEGVLGDESLVSFLAKNCKIPHIGLLDYLIDKDLLALIPQDVCWKYRLLPVDKMGKNLTIAMVNPLNNAALQAIRELCPGLRIKPILCSHEHFETVAKRLFGENAAEDDEAWSEVPVTETMEPSESAQKTEPEESAAPVAATTGSDPPEVIDEPVAAEAPPEPKAKALESQAKAPETQTKAPETPEAPTVEEPAPEPEAPEAPDVVAMDSNNLLGSIFGNAKVSEETDDEVESRPKAPPAEENTLESVMHSYTDAMVNSMHDTFELLARKISFFAGLKPEDVARIFAQGKVVEFEPASLIFDKGDTGDIMYVILNGCVKIRDGSKQIAILHAGDIFGEMALVSDKPRSATAVTMTQSDFLALSFSDFLHSIPPHVAAQLLINIIITLAERLRIANKS